MMFLEIMMFSLLQSRTTKYMGMFPKMSNPSCFANSVCLWNSACDHPYVPVFLRVLIMPSVQEEDLFGLKKHCFGFIFSQ